MITEYQSHDGAVDTDTAPKVQYAYADGTANTIRQTQLIYPNGRELTYDYGAANSTDDAASRVASLIDDDGTTHLTDYSYLGMDTFVVTDYTEPETEYTLIGTAGGDDPDTGDIYRGLDRFGRIKDSYWYNYGASSDTDRIKYGYDRGGNRLWRENVVATAAGKEFDELYQYDQIHRLKHMDRGTLNGPHTGMTTTTFAQCFTLDETGNWGGFREDDTGDGTWDLIQAREANPVNEISGISESAGPTWVSPTYSPAGNMTLMPQPDDPTAAFAASYDAWNRLIKVVDTESTGTVSTYAYDGAQRRIIQDSYVEGILDETQHSYFTQQSHWQELEVRSATTPNSVPATQQFVWGLRYVDDCVLCDRDTGNNDELEERLYALQDANWNVIGLIDANGTPERHMMYTPYGSASLLSAEWLPVTNSLVWERLYSGYCYESSTGLYHVRCRVYLVPTGAWAQRDALPESSTRDLYTYCRNNPLRYRDPFGLQAAGDDLEPNWPRPDGRLIPPFIYPSDNWEDDWSEGWNVDSLLNPANWNDSTCGNSSGTFDINAKVISEDSVFATPESILEMLKAKGLKAFPMNWNVEGSCGIGYKCCKVSTLNLDISVRYRISASVATRIGVVNLVFDLAFSLKVTLDIAVCLPVSCPCPPRLPPLVITHYAEHTNEPFPIVIP